MSVSTGEALRVNDFGPARTSVRGSHEHLREVTGRVVGSVFYGTMLKLMRNSSFKTRIGHGGRGEDAFAGQLDGILAERLGNATKRGLGEALFRHLERQQGRMDVMRERTGVAE